MVITYVGIFTTIVLLAIAGTLRTIRRNLIDFGDSRRLRYSAGFIWLLEGFCYFVSLVFLIIAAPHPLTIVAIFVFAASLITFWILRAAEERRVLNVWLEFASNLGVPFPRLLDRLGRSFRSSLSARSRNCAIQMSLGQAFGVAAVKSKLPVEASLLVADGSIAGATNDNASPNAEGSLSRHQVGSRMTDSSISETESSTWINQQLAYAFTVPVIALYLGILVESYLMPTIEQVQFEMIGDVRSQRMAVIDTAKDALGQINWFAGIIIFTLLGWPVLAMMRRWLPGTVVRWIPWFGRSGIDLWRADLLAQLSGGIDRRLPSEDLLRAIRATARPIWLRSRCSVVIKRLQSGMQFPDSLQKAKLISKSERAWLVAAESNRHLPQTLACLSSDILRSRTNRWRLRVTWLVPAVTLLVSFYVLLHATYLMGVLSYMIEQIST
ncbi:MAG: type II secretion system F family protein [Planctomycetota bacterium]